MQRIFLNYNTLQYAIADPRYAVCHPHNDGYSGLHCDATLVTAFVAVPRFAVDYYTDVPVTLSLILTCGNLWISPLS